MSKTAFISGANGFLGSYLIKLLEEYGIQVTAFILRGTDCDLLNQVNPVLKSTTIIEGNILKKETFEEHLKDKDYIFHLAGIIQGYTQEEYDRVNVEGTKNILEACLDKNPNVERVVILSSAAAGGYGTPANPLTEDKEPKPLKRDFYGISKLKMEKIVYPFMDKLAITIVRPCAALGPGNKVTQDMYKSNKIRIQLKIIGPYRPLTFIDARDLVKAIYLSAVIPEAKGEIFYIGHDDYASFYEIQKLVSEYVFHRRKGNIIIYTPKFIVRFVGMIAELVTKMKRKPAGFVNQSKTIAVLAPGQVISSEKAKRILRWKAEIDFATSISQEGKWNKKNGLI